MIIKLCWGLNKVKKCLELILTCKELRHGTWSGNNFWVGDGDRIPFSGCCSTFVCGNQMWLRPILKEEIVLYFTLNNHHQKAKPSRNNYISKQFKSSGQAREGIYIKEPKLLRRLREGLRKDGAGTLQSWVVDNCYCLFMDGNSWKLKAVGETRGRSL